MEFKILSNKLAKYDMIVFFDLEANQINHKAISLGLVAFKKKEGEIDFDLKNPITYHTLIKADEPIGRVVEELTCIHDKDILQHGKNIHDVVLDVSKLLRHYNKCFVSYGNQDISILHNSLNMKNTTEGNFFRNVINNYFDFYSYLMKRIVRENGTAYSISYLLSLYGLDVKGRFHDPMTDSYSLAKIYKSYINDEEKTMSLIMKNLSAAPIRNQVFATLYQQLERDKSVTMDDAIKTVRKFL